MNRTASRARKAATALAALVQFTQIMAPSASAAPAIWEAWPMIDADEDGDCHLQILGNGKFMLIRATGLGPAQQGRFHINNATMTPVDWSIIADGQGTFVRAFLPDQWSTADGTVRDDRHEGLVEVAITTPRCNLAASAPWRNTIRVIP